MRFTIYAGCAGGEPIVNSYKFLTVFLAPEQVIEDYLDFDGLREDIAL